MPVLPLLEAFATSPDSENLAPDVPALPRSEAFVNPSPDSVRFLFLIDIRAGYDVIVLFAGEG